MYKGISQQALLHVIESVTGVKSKKVMTVMTFAIIF